MFFGVVYEAADWCAGLRRVVAGLSGCLRSWEAFWDFEEFFGLVVDDVSALTFFVGAFGIIY